MTWNDTWGAPTANYDLFAREFGGTTVVAMSQDDNPGVTKAPGEIMAVFNDSTGIKAYDIFIQNPGNASVPKTFDMFVLSDGSLACGAGPDTQFNYNTIGSSVPAQSDAGGGVISAGAIGASDPGLNDIELFSSRGPTNNGAIKPDVTAVDGVSVTGSGGFPATFFGTSAAGPHVAGLAALLLQVRPDLRSGEAGDDPAADRAALRAAIMDTAVDLGAFGADNTYGSGRIDGLAAGQSVAIPTPTLSIADTTVVENAGLAVLTISLAPTATTDVTVQFATADGTATSPNDYLAVVAATATIPAGVTSATVDITIVDDAVREDDETFTVTLSNPSADAVIDPAAASATVTIDDDDGPPVLEIDTERDITINGIAVSDFAGRAVGTGDLNNDGLQDLIIGASGADPGGKSGAGTTYILFGPLGAGPLDLSTADVTVNGIDTGDASGSGVASGDINNDGIDDLIIGAYLADPGGRVSAGETYVVFGPLNPGTVNLQSLSRLTVNGISGSDHSGRSVGSADVNNDGIDDLIIWSRPG